MLELSPVGYKDEEARARDTSDNNFGSDGDGQENIKSDEDIGIDKNSDFFLDDDEDCNVVVNDEESGSDGEADIVDDEDDDEEGQLSSNGSSDSTPRDDEFDNLSIENDICLRDS